MYFLSKARRARTATWTHESGLPYVMPVPAYAGINSGGHPGVFMVFWIPACAGMTVMDSTGMRAEPEGILYAKHGKINKKE